MTRKTVTIAFDADISKAIAKIGELSARWHELADSIEELSARARELADSIEGDTNTNVETKIHLQIKRQILNALRDSSEPLNQSEVLEAIDRDSTDKTGREVLKSMEREGFLERSKKGYAWVHSITAKGNQFLADKQKS